MHSNTFNNTLVQAQFTHKQKIEALLLNFPELFLSLSISKFGCYMCKRTQKYCKESWTCVLLVITSFLCSELLAIAYGAVFCRFEYKWYRLFCTCRRSNQFVREMFLTSCLFDVLTLEIRQMILPQEYSVCLLVVVFLCIQHSADWTSLRVTCFLSIYFPVF